jgi:F-box interacting protein
MDHRRPEKRCRTTPPPLTAGVALPDDLIFMEILVRLPVKCLLRFKCVCRSWRARMQDAGFVRRQCDFSRTSRPPSMLVVARKNAYNDEEDEELSEPEDIAFYRLRPGHKPGDFETKPAELLLDKAACPPEAAGVTDVIHVAHCDGLVALATTTNQVFVCNPATQELVALPLGSPDVDTDKFPSVAIGFDRSRDQYVVARYFYRRWCYDKSRRKLDYDIGHEVFALGGSDSWSWELTVDPPHSIGGTPPVCVGDAFYWACDDLEDPCPSSLLRFGLRDRTFDDLVPCPPHFAYNPTLDHLAELDGKLCHSNNGASLTTFEVWQLADGDDTHPAQWSLRCRIDPGPLYDEGFGCYGFQPLWAARGGMLVRVSDNDEMLYWCDEKGRGVEEVLDLEVDVDSEHDKELKNHVYHVVPYRESLVPITPSNVIKV